MPETYANNVATTLNGAITAGATTLVVASATGFPTKGNFRLIIDSELLLVTLVVGTTFTVTRGIEGTTATTHSNGAAVTHILTAQSLQNIGTNPIGDVAVRGQGMYVAVHFEQNSSTAFILISADAISWALMRPTPVYSPSGGARDPSLYYDGRLYWMAYTRATTPTASWGLASSSDLINWTHKADFDFSAGGITLVWAPEFFVDDDNSVHIFVSCGVSNTTMQLYETHPTATDFSTWSTKVQITGTSLPADYIDAFVIKVSGSYYIFYKNDTNKYIEVMSSTTLTSGYSVVASGHWLTNWPVVSGNGWEGPCLVQVDSTTWYMLVDSTDASDNGLGYYYSIFTGTAGSAWLTGTNWSALAKCNDPFIKRHGTILRIQDLITARNALAGFMTGTRNPGAAVSGATGVTNNATNVFTFNSTLKDDIGYFNGTTKFTVPTSGLYHISAFIHWPSSSIGIRIIELRKNGTVYINGQSDNAANTVNDVRQNSQALLYLNAGDYVELTGFQTSGSTLTPSVQTFSIAKV